MQALEAGCHVLGEKPISNEIAKAEAMVAKAREKGLCYGINLNHRFTPAARLAKHWQNEGRLGHLLFVNMSMWIKNPTESSPYFQIKALHPHTVDVMRYFCGDIEAVQCFATKAPGRTIWSTAHFNMRFKNGAVGGLTGSYDIERGHPMERCEVAGTQGPLRHRRHVPRGDAVSRRQPGEDRLHQPGLRRHVRDFEDTFSNRIHGFLEQVSDGVAPGRASTAPAPTGWPRRRCWPAAIESLDNGDGRACDVR